jgi:hypothetical protein
MRYAWVVSVLLAGAALSMAAQNEPARSFPTSVEGRLQIVKPATELQVATPNDVVLKFGNYGAKHVAVSWKPLFNTAGGWDNSREEEPPEATRRSDGETVISVHPPTLGKYELQVNVDFEDNKFGVARTEVNVRVPDRNPEKFVVGDGVPVFALDLDARSKRSVSGIALYSDYRLPVEVDAASMQFSLKTVPGQSPVDIDPKTGVIIARSLGQAVLTVKFGGFERKACIIVLQSAQGGGYSKCPDVVPGGLQWTSDEWGRPSRTSGPQEPPRVRRQ